MYSGSLVGQEAKKKIGVQGHGYPQEKTLIESRAMPTPKKTFLMESRAMPTPKKKAAKTTTTTTTSPEKKNCGKSYDSKEKLHRARLAATRDGRLEVTAYTLATNRRVHVTTILSKVWGHGAEAAMQGLVSKINDGHLTKPAALLVKQGLR